MVVDLASDDYLVSLRQEWLTPTVHNVAQSIAQDSEYDRLPILADALEDAGCTDVDLLNYCRQPGENVDWLVRQVLASFGKNLNHTPLVGVDSCQQERYT